MKDDRSEELERLEKALLAAMETHDEEPEFEIADDEADILADALIREVMAEPAFEDPDRIHEPEEPLVYCNYSNDYGRKETEENSKEKKEKADKVDMALMITASALCLGIIGVLAYWLVLYL